MISCPCKECEKRNTYCHAECEIYKDFATQKRNERIQTNKQNASLDKMWNYGRKKKK